MRDCRLIYLHYLHFGSYWQKHFISFVIPRAGNIVRSIEKKNGCGHTHCQYIQTTFLLECINTRSIKNSKLKSLEARKVEVVKSRILKYAAE
jgi:hypothetical protein